MITKPTLYSCLAALGLTFGLGTPPALAFVNVAVTPTNQLVLAGSNAVFTVQATPTAGETITAYSWQIATSILGPFNPVPGATTTSCTLTNVQTPGTNYCYAKVTYNSGTDVGLVSVSPAVRYFVFDQARIITQPVGGLIRRTGSNATFSVTAAGTPAPTYQWRLNGVNLAPGTRITGVTTANLSLAALITADSGSYDVVVSNSVVFDTGTTNYVVTSVPATLGVFSPVGISPPPPSTNYAILGSNAVFTISATGTPPLSFRWLRDGTNLVNADRISGATSNVLTIAATTTNDESAYNVIITNPVSGPLTSSVTRLTVLIPPTFTSPTNLAWVQGQFLSFTNTATGTLPITFGARGLPRGLSIEPTTGVISGTSPVTGEFLITVYATNAAMTSTGLVDLTLTTGVPGITSVLFASGKQGDNFNYTILASNGPTSFACSALPAGMSLDPIGGVISGPPIVSGTFPVTITAINPFGSDTQVLTIALDSAIPQITSSRTATGTENQSGFRYTIRASNSPTSYGAANLPLGLTINTTSGTISGTPWVAGTYSFPIRAINAWGTGTTNLVLTVNSATLGSLAISGVTHNWSTPYLLDFAFSLRDAANNEPLVRDPSQFQVQPLENWVPLGGESPVILQSASAKQMKTFLALDYTYSMLASPGAIDAMQAAAELLVNQEPPHAMFGIIEFSADYVVPQFVTNRLTTANNLFITDKTLLSQTIDGIQTNFVQGNYAASRCWDALWLALQQYGPANSDEARYLVAMTDGNDASSSIVPTTTIPPGGPYSPLNAVNQLIAAAKANNVTIYCVGFGNNVNTTALQMLSSQTGGRYYLAATTTDLATQFQRILKELDGQYVLRWATSQRVHIPAYPNDGFQPAFQIAYGGQLASWNTSLVTTNVTNIDMSVLPYVTNVFLTNFTAYAFDATDPSVIGDIKLGFVRLVADAELGPQTIRLRSTYTPRSVTRFRLNYRPNYPCTASLNSTNAGEILYGWSMTETSDAAGTRTLTMSSSTYTNVLTAIPYAAFGDLLSFNFKYPDALTTTQAFSLFVLDNSIYTNPPPGLPSGIRFTNTSPNSFTNFITQYPTAPPHGTPIPWLLTYKYPTNNPAAVELQIGANGLPLWQSYVAGLNPTNASSRFVVSSSFIPGQTPQISFNTVLGRTYRVECATSVTSWSVLLDNIPGNGGTILFIDNRTLTGVNTQFYRVAVYY